LYGDEQKLRKEEIARHAARPTTLIGRTGAIGFALAIMASAASAENVLPTGEQCVVNVPADDELNVRTLPNADSSIIARVAPNECGLIITGPCQRYWCPIEKKEATGWVNRRFIANVSQARYCVTGVAPYDKLRMRASPSLQASVLIELPSFQCNIALLPFSTNGWQKVRLEEWEGWVRPNYLNSR
jgi:SH3-like domain-containing protein